MKIASGGGLNDMCQSLGQAALSANQRGKIDFKGCKGPIETGETYTNLKPTTHWFTVEHHHNKGSAFSRSAKALGFTSQYSPE
jgi:hypothetical protein